MRNRNRITLEITGVREAAIAVGKWGEDVQRRLASALEREANYAVVQMRQRVPIGRTGNLLKGTARVDRSSDGLTVTVRNTAQHAHLIEWGHRIVTTKGRDTGRTARRASPSFFVVPMQDARRRAFDQARTILGTTIPVLDATPEVTET